MTGYPQRQHQRRRAAIHLLIFLSLSSNAASQTLASGKVAEEKKSDESNHLTPKVDDPPTAALNHSEEFPSHGDGNGQDLAADSIDKTDFVDEMAQPQNEGNVDTEQSSDKAAFVDSVAPPPLGEDNTGGAEPPFFGGMKPKHVDSDDTTKNSASAKQDATTDETNQTIPFVIAHDKSEMMADASSLPPSELSANKGPATAAAAAAKRKLTEHQRYRLPDGFNLAAHVVTDPSDGLSYFATAPPSTLTNLSDSDAQQHLQIPYMECGSSGSTTQAITIRLGHFRHLPPGTRPHSWTTATSTHQPGEGGLLSSLGDGLGLNVGGVGSDRRGQPRKDPQLLVALGPLELTVSGNGGQTRTFGAGNVVLLEDTVGRGHKLSPTDGEELSVLMLSLPRHHHHHNYLDHHELRRSGDQFARVDDAQLPFTSSFRRPISNARRHLSVLGLRRRGADGGRVPLPCRSQAAASSPAEFDVAAALLGDDMQRRRILLGTVGLGLSSFVTYFLVVVAPPVLGVLGLATTFVGGAFLADGLIGMAAAEAHNFLNMIQRGGGSEDDDAIAGVGAEEGDLREDEVEEEVSDMINLDVEQEEKSDNLTVDGGIEDVLAVEEKGDEQ